MLPTHFVRYRPFETLLTVGILCGIRQNIADKQAYTAKLSVTGCSREVRGERKGGECS